MWHLFVGAAFEIEYLYFIISVNNSKFTVVLTLSFRQKGEGQFLSPFVRKIFITTYVTVSIVMEKVTRAHLLIHRLIVFIYHVSRTKAPRVHKKIFHIYITSPNVSFSPVFVSLFTLYPLVNQAVSFMETSLFQPPRKF